MAKKQEKGDEGKGTGPAVRRAIEEKISQGMTQEEIGRRVNRDGGTIGQIQRGEIKNPPAGLAEQIRKIMVPETVKKMKQELKRRMGQ
jgi:transcriptional regulator with XRE-family HTH domain